MVRFGAKKEEFIPPFLFLSTNKKRGIYRPYLFLNLSGFIYGAQITHLQPPSLPLQKMH